MSADYLLFGIETENREINKQTGLSNDAIRMLMNAHNKNNKANDIYGLLSSLLADRDFCEFIKDVDFHAAELTKLENMIQPELDAKYPGVNMLGYTRWSLVEETQDFIYSQLQKHGYKIKDSK